MAHDVLIVDDEADIRLLIGGLLGDEGYQTREAGDADSALEAIRNRRPNLVLLDIWLQGSRLDGLELLSEIKRDHPDVPGGDDDGPWVDRDRGGGDQAGRL